MTRLFLLAAALAAGPALAQDLTPPAATPDLVAPTTVPGSNWRSIATEDDRRRLREWRKAWMEALSGARAQNRQDEIAAEGVLLDPDVALGDPAPPPGDYNCRVVKLGSQSTGPAFIAYPTFLCRIEADPRAATFTKLTGSQRPIGRLYRDLDLRMVFLGTMQLGDEVRAYQYGIDRERDMIGLVQRVGENRWRLVLPYPHFESLLDVVELTPR